MAPGGSVTAKSRSARAALLLRAFAAWAAFSVVGFLPEFFFQLYDALDRLGVIFEPIADQPQSAWALANHFAGFAVFLFMITNKKRWLVIPVVSTVWFMWLWRWSQLPREWWSLATHVLGYLVMVVALLMVMGVLSGLVFLWVELLSFLRQLWIFYPEVKHELRSHPLLEAVIVSASGPGATATPMMVMGADDGAGSGGTPLSAALSSAASAVSSVAAGQPMRKIVTVDKADDVARCFLCRDAAVAYVEVCSEWVAPTAAGGDGGRRLRVCTPFATLREEHHRLREQLRAAAVSTAQLRADLDASTRTAGDLRRQMQQLVAERAVLRARLDAPAPIPALAPALALAPAPAPASAEPVEPAAASKKERDARYLLTVVAALEEQLAERELELQRLLDELQRQAASAQAVRDEWTAQAQRTAEAHAQALASATARVKQLEREQQLMSWVASSLSF